MERTLLNCTRSISQCLKATPCSASAPLRPTFRTRSLRSTARWLHTTPVTSARSATSQPPKSRDRGPKSNEDTQTDFAALDVLRNTAPPATAIDSCTPHGFQLDNRMKIYGCGLLLLGGEAYRWRPWHQEGRKEETDEAGHPKLTGRLQNDKGQFHVENDVWGVLELAYPKPDLLIIGTGPRTIPVSPQVRRYLNDLGIRLEIQDTRSAASQFNLLATERGPSQIAAALVPIGWKESR